jgi:hypothetical protein
MAPPEKDTIKTDPDPTTAVKEALELGIKNLSHEISVRFGGIDQATLIAARTLVDTIDVINHKILGVKELVTQQTISNRELVTQQATSNKELVNQARELTALALTAALQTQEKSAAETRTFIQESIRQLKSGVDESNKTTNEKIEVLRDMVTRLASRLDLAQGGFINSNDSRRDNREISRDNERSSSDYRSLIVAVIAVVISGAAILIGLNLHK